MLYRRYMVKYDFDRQIERDRHGYEIELTNRLELKFNKTFKLIEIDD